MPDDFVPKPFRCEEDARDGALYIRPHGDLDLSTAPVLEQALRDALDRGQRSLVLDLRGLNFMDSTGLTMVTRLNNEARPRRLRSDPDRGRTSGSCASSS